MEVLKMEVMEVSMGISTPLKMQAEEGVAWGCAGKTSIEGDA
jgi:hypothetical protein